jgi:hypothetical protein
MAKFTSTALIAFVAGAISVGAQSTPPPITGTCTAGIDYCGYDLIDAYRKSHPQKPVFRSSDINIRPDYTEDYLDYVASQHRPITISPTNAAPLAYNSLFVCSSANNLTYIEYCGLGQCNDYEAAHCENGGQPYPLRKRWEAKLE